MADYINKYLLTDYSRKLSYTVLMICCTVFLSRSDFYKHFFSDSQYTLCMVIFLKMKLGKIYLYTYILCVIRSSP